MSRYDVRISELTKLGYTLEQEKEHAKIEENEQQTDALERIADALEICRAITTPNELRALLRLRPIDEGFRMNDPIIKEEKNADALEKQNAGKREIGSLHVRFSIDKENVMKRITEGNSIEEAIKGNVKVIGVV